MPIYNTPGVYVEEISTLPPSVAEVSTAIPAFIGYTEKRPTDDKGKEIKVCRINTLLDYKTLFGRAPCNFKATVESGNVVINFANENDKKFLMYYGLSLYFNNGGGSCYIVSVGNYDNSNPKKQDFIDGLGLLEMEDEPTLIVLLDAVHLDINEYYALCAEALNQCNKLRDRFLILDIPAEATEKPKEVSDKFRDKNLGKNLKYGAAYHPYLQTLLNYSYDDKKIIVYDQKASGKNSSSDLFGGSNGIKVTYTGEAKQVTVNIEVDNTTNEVKCAPQDDGTLKITIPPPVTGNTIVKAWTKISDGDKKGFKIEGGDSGLIASMNVPLGAHIGGISISHTTVHDKTPTVEIIEGTEVKIEPQDDGTLKITIPPPVTGNTIVKAWQGITDDQKKGFDIEQNGSGKGLIAPIESTFLNGPTLDSLKTTQNELYNKIKDLMKWQRVTLPPSPAIAGVYARVDRERGVWKAPANVSIASVLGPVSKITDEQQDNLNIDSTGKSINAIRAFPGKGTLIWGARTLAGNDNEWRYVSVRRLFITIEESARKATAFAVFEPNDATTWLKVKAMVESYLYGLWEQGALAGPKPESAYFVNVGLGRTMTAQDILEGRMIVEIGIAAVRPAEFIILKFSHKMQEA